MRNMAVEEQTTSECNYFSILFASCQRVPCWSESCRTAEFINLPGRRTFLSSTTAARRINWRGESSPSGNLISPRRMEEWMAWSPVNGAALCTWLLLPSSTIWQCKFAIQWSRTLGWRRKKLKFVWRIAQLLSTDSICISANWFSSKNQIKCFSLLHEASKTLEHSRMCMERQNKTKCKLAFGLGVCGWWLNA